MTCSMWSVNKSAKWSGVACLLVVGMVVSGAEEVRAQGGSFQMQWSPKPEAIVSRVGAKQIATGFTKPVFCASPKGDNTRLFVVEQGGLIWILNLQDGSRSTFLNISTLIATGGERGLLCLAFHPYYSQTRKFYVCYTGVAAGEIRVVEYQASASNPSVADTSKARLLLTFAKPQSNHNGGWIGFGMDNLLYIGTGDGGGVRDAGAGHTDIIGNAQDITDNWLGKILRINVNGDAFPADPNRNYTIPSSNPFVGQEGDDEIWAYGLRNPWRCSFDRATGNLYIGDVGQYDREEVNFQLKNAAGGRNYGWRFREGKIATPMVDQTSAPANPVEPVYDYQRTGSTGFEGRSVTGGYVYRGPITSIRGRYFFADYVTARIWSFEVNSPGFTTIRNLTDWTAALVPDAGTIDKISSFGEDNAGNLYIIDHFDGELYRIIQTTSSTSLETLIPPFVRGVMSTQPTE